MFVLFGYIVRGAIMRIIRAKINQNSTQILRARVEHWSSETAFAVSLVHIRTYIHTVALCIFTELISNVYSTVWITRVLQRKREIRRASSSPRGKSRKLRFGPIRIGTSRGRCFEKLAYERPGKTKTGAGYVEKGGPAEASRRRKCR